PPSFPPATDGGPAAEGSPASGPTPSDISFKARRSVLDAVLQDANRLKMSLGKVDSDRIDSHMDGIRALEMRLPTVSDSGTGGSSNASGGTGTGTGGTGSPATGCMTPA